MDGAAGVWMPWWRVVMVAQDGFGRYQPIIRYRREIEMR